MIQASSIHSKIDSHNDSKLCQKKIFRSLTLYCTYSCVYTLSSMLMNKKVCLSLLFQARVWNLQNCAKLASKIFVLFDRSYKWQFTWQVGKITRVQPGFSDFSCKHSLTPIHPLLIIRVVGFAWLVIWASIIVWHVERA